MREAPLNLIWSRPRLDKALEGYFIREVLLADIGRPIRTMAFERDAKLPMLDNVLVVSFKNELADYLGDLRANGRRNIGLFHMADELGDDDRGFYRHADYVLRHYWFAEALAKAAATSPSVTWMPNGYRDGLGPMSPRTMLKMADRPIMGFFAGALQGRSLLKEREHMTRVLGEAKLPFMATGTPGFAQGFGPVSYTAYMSSARFALVPGGNSPETIRLYDALEAGAIPIMLKSPFVSAKDALDNPPFILLDSWDELPGVYAPFAQANDPAVVTKLDAMQAAVLDWWANFKLKQQRKVKELVEGSFMRNAAKE